MQGEKVESPTEEGGDLTSPEEEEVLEVEEEEEEEEEEEVGVGKEELDSGMMGMISALILDPLAPADLAKDEAVAAMLVAEAVVEGGEGGGGGKVGIEMDMVEAIGKAAARLFQVPWRESDQPQSQVRASGRR
ncbi:hypothetical protein INR49_026587 [Caranx melampygus]|nr:hypothetical protein INR49_026587 [Caranx melampygus]